MPRSRPPKVGTLADVLRQGSQLWLHCCDPDCRRHVQLDPLALAAAHGEDLALQRLLERARCSACGRRDVDLQVPPDVGPGGLLRRGGTEPS